MKRTILMITALVLTLSIYAQPPGQDRRGKGGKGKMEQRKGGFEKEMKDLNLSETQQKEMDALKAKFGEKMKAIRQNESITVKQQRDEMYELMQQHRNEVNKILTPTQQQQLKSKREEGMAKMEKGQARNFEKRAEKLNLTEAQKTQVSQLNDKTRTAMKALRANESLDRATKEASIRKQMEQHKMDLGKILSKEQMQQWEQMNKEQMRNGSKGRKGQGKGRPAMQV